MNIVEGDFDSQCTSIRRFMSKLSTEWTHQRSTGPVYYWGGGGPDAARRFAMSGQIDRHNGDDDDHMYPVTVIELFQLTL